MSETASLLTKGKLLALGCAAVCVVSAATIAVMLHASKPEEDAGLGYASKGVVVMSEADLKNLGTAGDNRIGLRYKNDAHSEDGLNFSCYIGNSERNKYDAFFSIYSDIDFKDELFLSELLRPGEAFETLTLEHELPSGDHTVYVALTQVEDDHKTMHAQTVFTVEFHVA